MIIRNLLKATFFTCIACIALGSCKKDSKPSLSEEVKTYEKLPDNISPEEFKVVKQYYSKIIGVDTGRIIFNVSDKTFSIPQTQIKDEYQQIKLSYETYTKYHKE
ncbi:hypothetical protein DHW03_14755 [Pedobacter yonginense]|uniref:Uncharacterized protein n=1 Tax=Pedobacter yonginense TaxID=651869 RepID=A0A317EM54_9SPHI|nr:hypothetical protein [Pedobacter yonginense]PWS27247.1 hypothetical protein DHW03_14755 [Pedobacter yonginense]